MAKYIARRILQIIPLIVALSFLTFLLMDAAPGDPAQRRLAAQGIAIDEAVLEGAREEMGLNRPVLARYLDWLGGALRGDLGASYRDGLPVAHKLAGGIGATCVLAAASLALSMLIALPLGLISALRRDGLIDHIVRALSFVGISLPNFLISVVLMYLLCIRLNWLPVVSEMNLRGLILPCAALSIPLAGSFVRQIRAQALEQLSRAHVEGARMRGVKEWRVLLHDVLKNALIPIITLAALSVGTLMGGSVVIETTFRWPGMGKLAMDAISARDYPVVQGFVVVTAAVYAGVNLLADVLYRLIDPRIGAE